MKNAKYLGCQTRVFKHDQVRESPNASSTQWRINHTKRFRSKLDGIKSEINRRAKAIAQLDGNIIVPVRGSLKVVGNKRMKAKRISH